LSVSWPEGERGHHTITRLIETGNEVVVTYEKAKPDGGTGVNTEVFTFAGDKLRSIEVYWGWDK
jgi:hypothetical protein